MSRRSTKQRRSARRWKERYAARAALLRQYEATPLKNEAGAVGVIVLLHGLVLKPVGC